MQMVEKRMIDGLIGESTSNGEAQETQARNATDLVSTEAISLLRHQINIRFDDF